MIIACPEVGGDKMLGDKPQHHLIILEIKKKLELNMIRCDSALIIF